MPPCVIGTHEKWLQSTGELVPNKRYLRKEQALGSLGTGLLGLGTTLAVVQLSQAEEQFDIFVTDLRTAAAATDRVDRAIKLAIAAASLKNYLETVTLGASEAGGNFVLIGFVYRVLLPQLAEPNSIWTDD